MSIRKGSSSFGRYILSSATFIVEKIAMTPPAMMIEKNIAGYAIPDTIPVTMKIPEPLIAPKRPISRSRMVGPGIFLFQEVSFSHYVT